MAKITVRLLSPAARSRFGIKNPMDTIEVEEKNFHSYLSTGVAIKVGGKPTKERATKKRGGVETATK